MQSTQQRHPWRSTFRSVFAFVVGLASMWGLVVELLGLDKSWQWVSASLVVATAISRLLADPRVLAFLERFAPWLLPAPPAVDEAGRDAAGLDRP